MGRFPNSRAINRILLNKQGTLSGEDFFEPGGEPGDTLSVIFSDFNNDGALDFAEANDFHQPDSFFLGDGNGKLKKIHKEDNLIPNTPETTMSIKTADLDNDGDFEVLMTQIAGGPNGLSDRLLLRPIAEFCKDIERSDDRTACQKNIDMREWHRPGGFRLNIDNLEKCKTLGEAEELQCRAMVVRDIAVRTDNRAMCEKISDQFLRQKMSCKRYFELKREPKPLIYSKEIQQIKGRNVLLESKGGNKFEDVTIESGIDLGGWSWDVKINAFSNSEFQDVFIMNGFWGQNKISQSKVFMKNKGNLKFEDGTVEAGAVDYGIIASAAAADYDNDGDIDLIATAQNGPLVAFWNNNQNGNSIIVELEDHIGNRFGIGSKIRIFYGADNQRLQLRELQLSGGFAAFDAPYVHFGLGEFENVSAIEVEWSTGEKSLLPGPFSANNKYRIRREAAN